MLASEVDYELGRAGTFNKLKPPKQKQKNILSGV
jgi:hypothetical protein